MMKSLAIALVAALLLPAGAASAQVRVKGYVKKDGTYVAPHVRSRPNNTTFDNYSTKGNYNPYTGKAGTQSPYSNPYGYGGSRSSSAPSSTYGSGYGYGTEANDGDDE